MVSGGFGDGVASVEVVVPATGQFCSMPDLPDENRYYHTMDGVFICGGKRSNSLQFSDGEWTIFYEMEESFEGHSSWEIDQGMFLLGGFNGATTFVPKPGEEERPAFELAHKSSRYGCAITDLVSDSVVMTGGGVGESFVTRYDREGFVEELPQMLVARQDHGCGSFLRSDGTQVSNQGSCPTLSVYAGLLFLFIQGYDILVLVKVFVPYQYLNCRTPVLGLRLGVDFTFAMKEKTTATLV